MEADLEKIKCVQEATFSNSKKELWSFLRFCFSNWRFVQGFAYIVAMLRKLSSQEYELELCDHAVEAYKLRRAAMARLLVFTLFNLKKHFHLFTDDSKYGFEGALMQKDQKERLATVQYALQTSRNREQILRTLVREPAVVMFEPRKVLHYPFSVAFTFCSCHVVVIITCWQGRRP